MATSAMSIHTPSGNRNAESVNTHISIHPVAILEQLVTSTVVNDRSLNNRCDYYNCFHKNLDYMLKSEF